MNKTKIRATEQPIAVDIEGLSAMLSCGRATARKIGEQAGAKIVRGRRVLYSIEKVKKYLLYLEEQNDFLFMFSGVCSIIRKDKARCENKKRGFFRKEWFSWQLVEKTQKEEN